MIDAVRHDSDQYVTSSVARCNMQEVFRHCNSDNILPGLENFELLTLLLV